MGKHILLQHCLRSQYQLLGNPCLQFKWISTHCQSKPTNQLDLTKKPNSRIAYKQGYGTKLPVRIEVGLEVELEVEPEVEPGVELGVCPGSVDSVDFAPPLLNVHSPVQSILPKCTLPCN